VLVRAMSKRIDEHVVARWWPWWTGQPEAAALIERAMVER
jgi:hypothetical protein